MTRLLAGFLAAAAAARADVPPADAELAPARRAAFLVRPATAHGAAMGEAWVASADGPAAGTWNPAGLGRLRRPCAVATRDSAGAGMALSCAAVAAPVGPGTAAWTLASFDYGSYERRDDRGTSLGAERVSDLAVSASWAAPAWRGLPGWMGVALEVVRESFGGTAPAVSAGWLAPLGTGWTAGAAVQHVGLGGAIPFPETGRIGLSLAAGALGLAAEGAWPLRGGAARFGSGAELAVHPAVRLRAGYSFRLPDQGWTGVSGLTTGLGFALGRVGLSYAFRPFGRLASSHMISVGWAASPRAEAAAGDAARPEDRS